MAVTFTSIVNIKDWKALQELNRETLVNQADKIGATYFQIYRNLNDVSQMLIIAEFPDYAIAIDRACRQIHVRAFPIRL